MRAEMGEPSGTETLRRYAQPSLVCTSREMSGLHKMAASLTQFLRTRFHTFLARHRESPVQMFYSADGTPVTTNSQWTRVWGLVSPKRSGRQANELLVHRLFGASASGETHVLLEEPRPIRNKNKIAWVNFEAMRQFRELGRLWGHRGILHEQYASGRAPSSAPWRGEQSSGIPLRRPKWKRSVTASPSTC